MSDNTWETRHFFPQKYVFLLNSTSWSSYSVNKRTSDMLQHHRTMCLVKFLFGIKTMNKLENLAIFLKYQTEKQQIPKCVNARFVVHLLFMMYNVVVYFC